MNILVIGASSGIGYAATKFLAKKHNVVAVARRQERLKIFKNYRQFDISNLELIKDFLADIVTKNGKLDALIFCAGVQDIKPLKVVKASDAQYLFTVNYFAPLFFAKCFASKRISNADANMVFISSIAGFAAEPGIVNYSASKAALNNLIQGLAKEVAPIRVNGIAPGFLKTEMTKSFAHIYDENFISKLEKNSPLGIVQVDDIVDAIEFLSSDKASKITGEILKVDGGAL